ncbi:DUF6959 family protein [Pararhizobium gei]|uniref:DUF6959 family protein n=1 Tax=Pararhizobium gei TaxID=1395951 RepID=UPI0023DA5CC7|nr:hypothetical protein [Rhizobium gei]
MQTAELFTQPHNFAVVQLPERNYPGVVFQGDSLHCLLRDVTELQKLLKDGNLDELSENIEHLKSDLANIQNSYERVCYARKIELPYVK